jgi:hypothetical protein
MTGRAMNGIRLQVELNAVSDGLHAVLHERQITVIQ